MNFNAIFILFLILPFALKNLEKEHLVYDVNFRKQKISIDSKSVIILKGTISCDACLIQLIAFYEERLKVVSLIAKTKFSVKQEFNALKKMGLRDEQIFFQFSEKDNMYRPKKTNKIFQNLPSQKFPLIMLLENGNVKIYDYPQFEEFILNQD